MNYEGIFPHAKLSGMWTGGQFSLIRLLVGSMSILLSLEMIFWGNGVFSVIFPSIMIIASFLFVVGIRTQEIAMFMIFASVFFPQFARLFWTILYIWLNSSPVPYGSIDAIKSVDPRNMWKIQNWAYNVLWVVFCYGMLIVFSEVMNIFAISTFCVLILLSLYLLPLNWMVWVFWGISVVASFFGFKPIFLHVPSILLATCDPLILFFLFIPFQRQVDQNCLIVANLNTSIGKVVARFVLSEDVLGTFKIVDSNKYKLESKFELFALVDHSNVYTDWKAIVHLLSLLGSYWNFVSFVFSVFPKSVSSFLITLIASRESKISNIPSLDTLPEDLKVRVNPIDV